MCFAWLCSFQLLLSRAQQLSPKLQTKQFTQPVTVNAVTAPLSFFPVSTTHPQIFSMKTATVLLTATAATSAAHCSSSTLTVFSSSFLRLFSASLQLSLFRETLCLIRQHTTLQKQLSHISSATITATTSQTFRQRDGTTPFQSSISTKKKATSTKAMTLTGFTEWCP